MSSFHLSTSNFIKQYDLNGFDRIKLYMSYPFFKATWYINNNHKNIFSKFVNFLGGYLSISIVLNSSFYKKIRLTLNLTSDDIQSFKEIFYGGEYSSDLQISEGLTLVDCGSNNGMSALYFASRFNFKRVVAIEANPAMGHILKLNLMGLPAEVSHSHLNLCLSGQGHEKIPFYVTPNNRLSSMNEIPGGVRIDVESRPLRTVVDQLEIESGCVLKMDIEGAEFDILESDPTIFKAFRFIFIEVHGDKVRRDKFVKQIEHLGFIMHKRTEFSNSNCETTIFKSNI